MNTQTRAQRREIERITNHANETFRVLSDRLLDEFTRSENPEGEETAKVLSTIDAQWKAYCKTKRLTPATLSAIQKFTEGLLKEYHESLKKDDTMAN